MAKLEVDLSAKDMHAFLKEPHFTLQHIISPDSPPNVGTTTGELRFIASKLIYDGTKTLVYRGSLVGNDSRDDDIKVVAKLSTTFSTMEERQEYRDEAAIYENQLSDLQGHIIPRFYGLFSGSIAGTERLCLVLEDCGVSVPSFGSLSMGWRCVLCLLASGTSL